MAILASVGACSKASSPLSAQITSYPSPGRPQAARAARGLVAQARELEAAGAFLIVVEAVPATVGRAITEASGGITLENIRQYAATGVDFLSVGALTKDLRAIDLSMLFRID